ncbi:unnamed protein product [Pedinophyceae sp. YPF-701]|nr:unnamed protein product [Pedinophyceae sp. YPF-701]
MRGNAVLPGSPGRDGQFASRWTAAVRVFDTFNRMDIEAEEGLRKRMAVTVAQVFNPVLSKLEEGVKRLQERHAQLVQSPRPLALDNTSRLSSPAQAGPGPSAAERSGVSDVSRSSRAVRSLGPSFSQNASPVVAAQTTAGARSGTLHDSVLSGGTRVVPSGGVTGNLQASIPVVVMTQDQASQLSITA